MSRSITPMADCHVHVNGMIDDDSVLFLADRHRVTLPIAHITSTGRRTWQSYPLFHQAYDEGVSLIRSPEDLHFVAKKYLINVAEHGCLYGDLFSSSMNNYRGGDPWPVFRDNTLETLRAMDDARDATGIETSLAITLKRHHKTGVDGGHELIDLIRRFKEAGLDATNRVNAIHMAGDESFTTCRQFEPVYARAFHELEFKRNGIHAGEVSPANDIYDATNLIGVARSGHALSAIQNPWLLDDMQKRRIAIEITLLSEEILHGFNLNTHPVTEYFKRGLVIPGSDDPGLFGTTIADDYQKFKEYGFKDEHRATLTANGIREGFAPLERREFAMSRLAAFNAEHNIGLPMEVFNLRKPIDMANVIAALPAITMPSRAQMLEFSHQHCARHVRPYSINCH